MCSKQHHEFQCKHFQFEYVVLKTYAENAAFERQPQIRMTTVYCDTRFNSNVQCNHLDDKNEKTLFLKDQSNNESQNLND